MYKQAITLILSGFLSLPMFSQSEQKVEILTQYSETLDQERELKVYLPADYSPEQVYPVIYITDAAYGNFKVAKGYLDALSDPQYRIIPPSILVGIIHKKRNEEMNVFQEESGQRFMNYLFDEVVPNIDAAYSTSGFNAMIGHSNGAEYNHFLMLAKDNPFRGFISLSTAFNTDMKSEIAEFFRNYQGKDLYYFVGNGENDAQGRIQAGNDFEALYEENPNESILFANQTFEGGHNSVVPNAMLAGLKFIFRDYSNIKKYTSFTEYQENFRKDMMETFGLVPAYDFASIEPYFGEILHKKDIEQYEKFVEFADQHRLWYSNGGILDPVNRANQYFYMGMYPETIKYYNKALEDIESCETKVYAANLFRAVQAYEAEGRESEIMPFLIKSLETMGDDNRLMINYYIAKYSLENKVSLKEGQKALEYCKVNYVANRFFSTDDLQSLENRS